MSKGALELDQALPHPTSDLRNLEGVRQSIVEELSFVRPNNLRDISKST